MMHYLDIIRQLYGLSTDTEQGDAPIHPACLREYYLALGQHEAINQTHNRLLSPAEIYRTDSGYMVFYEENQAVAVWGIKEEDLHLTNPPVYGSYDMDREEWFRDADTTEKFLLSMAYWNAALGGLPYTACTEAPENMTPAVIAELTKGWTEQKDLTHQFLLFFTQGTNTIMVMTTTPEGDVNGIFLAANEQQAFEHILRQDVIEWDHRSDEDN